MKCAVLTAMLLLTMSASAQQPSVDGIRQKELKMLASLFAGTFTNEEQVYFQGETGQKKDPRQSIEVTSTGPGALVSFRDGSGQALVPPIPVTLSMKNDGVEIQSRTCLNHYLWRADRFVLDDAQSQCSWKGARFVSIGQQALEMREPGGRIIEYRRARPYSCWISIPKADKKPDGTTDWAFFGGQKLHDQGGRFWVATDEKTPQKIGFKLRNVIWPYGSNKPALTLYVYKADDSEKAVSYSWADPEAKLIGINLRWVQGSCSRE